MDFVDKVMSSPTKWTWVWVNSGSWWWTGSPGELQSMGSPRVQNNWTTELNRTDPFYTDSVCRCCYLSLLRGQAGNLEACSPAKGLWPLRELKPHPKGLPFTSPARLWDGNHSNSSRTKQQNTNPITHALGGPPQILAWQTRCTGHLLPASAFTSKCMNSNVWQPFSPWRIFFSIIKIPGVK